MKLREVRVSNYRSVEDSGWFKISQITSLVGKNEAGKTAILQALSGLNPHPLTPFVYNKERDYPRRYLNDFDNRHPDGKAVVVETKWMMTPEERADIVGEFGEGAIIKVPNPNVPRTDMDSLVTLRRHYDSNDLEWDIPIAYAQIVAHLLNAEGLTDSEREALTPAPITTCQLREVLEKVSGRTESQERLLTRLNNLPGKSAAGRIKQILSVGLPKFMYFSHYDRMDGQIRIDDLDAKLQNNTASTGERLFLDFLEYAGTSVTEIRAATTYEGLNARCESASNAITEDLLEYWTQNPDLEVDVRVTKAEPNDPPPFNSGVIGRARIRNTLHRVTVPFSERSAGFIWFFSFLIKFAMVQKDKAPVVLLLDEPGLTLHGKAQEDLLRYFNTQLAPAHQVIYSTHSPFMISAQLLLDVRIVEDRVIVSASGRRQAEGTKVRADVLATDPNTLFPLQGALGYEVTQTLFVGKHTLLVEGPGDILFLQSWSSALGRRGRTRLDHRWTICPAGGIDKIQSFVSLFGGTAKLEIATLTDFASGDKRKLDALRQANVLGTGRILDFASLLQRAEADAEDIFSPEVYSQIVNAAFVIPSEHALTPEKLAASQPPTTRILKQAEACVRLLPADVDEFDHFRPAEWLFTHPEILDGERPEVLATLDRAEIVLKALNKLLPPTSV